MNKPSFMALSESQEQSLLFKWTSWQPNPELKLMFAIPNGGKRDIITATHLKAEGVKAGVPDIFLPAPKGKYHGLFIEMKVKSNKPTELQQGWISALTSQGYQAIVCYGWEQASKAIITYLKENGNGSIC